MVNRTHVYPGYSRIGVLSICATQISLTLMQSVVKPQERLEQQAETWYLWKVCLSEDPSFGCHFKVLFVAEADRVRGSLFTADAGMKSQGKQSQGDSINVKKYLKMAVPLFNFFCHTLFQNSTIRFFCDSWMEYLSLISIFWEYFLSSPKNNTHESPKNPAGIRGTRSRGCVIQESTSNKHCSSFVSALEKESWCKGTSECPLQTDSVAHALWLGCPPQLALSPNHLH